MKYILCVFFAFLTFTLPLFSEEIPHLILYFDVNKTLIASDKAGKKSAEDVLNQLLAEKYKACWDTSLNKAMTYDDYVHEVLVPGSRDDQALKSQRKFYLHRFIAYLKEQNHPLYDAVQQDYETALKALKSFKGVVFSSFYSLLDDLDQKGISYSIILRSYGEEIFNVRDEIDTVHKKIFSQWGLFREGKLILENDEPIENSFAIYHQLRRIGHTAIHDDWKYWNGHDMSVRYGKPFYIDREDRETLPIFFDDNIRVDDLAKNIIAPVDIATGELIPVEELINSGQAVPVQTLNAILDTNYYINYVKKALDQHAQENKRHLEDGLLSHRQ